MQNLYSRDELIQQIKNCGQSIIDNAESILGDERYFMRLNVSFDILRLKAEVPSIEIKKEFTPEKEFEDELTYKEFKQRKENKKMVDPNKLNICRHCSDKKEPVYCEDCYQELISENAKLQKELYDFKSEHNIMKKVLIDHGLWEELLNNDEFLKYLREDYEG